MVNVLKSLLLRKVHLKNWIIFFIDSLVGVSQYYTNDNISYTSEGKYILFMIYIGRLMSIIYFNSSTMPKKNNL